MKTVTLIAGANAAIGESTGRIVVSHAAVSGIDVNLTAFLLDEKGRVTGDRDIVFYNQPQHPSGMVKFIAPTESKGQKQHCIMFDFSRAPASITRVAITLTEDAGVGFRLVPSLHAIVLTDAAEVHL
nr:TerD family protein [Chromatiaceae bacterium]